MVAKPGCACVCTWVGGMGSAETLCWPKWGERDLPGVKIVSVVTLVDCSKYFCYGKYF